LFETFFSQSAEEAELGFTGELIIEREISGPQQTEDIMKAIRYIRTLVKKYNKPHLP